MKDEVRTHLFDILEAGRAVRGFVDGKSFNDYVVDELLRSAVERKFEIMGEALNRMRRDAPQILEKIPNHRDIISFRNILAHGYDSVDDQIVWGIIQENLDDLLKNAADWLSK
jgi:uncharacterized protein with HEPN domain